MLSTAVITLPLSLAMIASLLASDVAIPASPNESSEQNMLIECTEIILEYQVGDRKKSTESSSCS